MNPTPYYRKRFLLVSLGSLFLAGLFAIGMTPTVRADDDCQKRIVRADHKLQEAVEHHGWDSPQAAHFRQDLAAARAWCWDHNHRWWDEDGNRWHTDRDWD